MLNAPATYLQNRNKKLAGLNAKIKKDYDDALLEIQGLALGYENSLWEQLAAEDALLKGKTRKRQIDIKFPILEKLDVNLQL